MKKQEEKIDKVGPRSIASSGLSCFLPFSVGWCCLVSFFFGWCCFSPLLWRGAAFLPLPEEWCFLPSRLLGRAAWFLPSLGGVAVYFFSFGGNAFLPLLWAELIFPSLLMGGAAWFPFFFGAVAVSPLLLHGAAFLPLGGAAFPLSSVGWCCLVFSSGGRCCCCLPSPPLGGTTFPPSSVGWCCLVHSGGVALFLLLRGSASLPMGWAVFFPPLVSLLWVVLSFFCPFGGTSFPVFCWVVLLGPLLLGVVLRLALSPPPLGGVAFPISFQVVLLPSPPLSGATFSSSSVGWCLVSSFFGWC